MESAMGFTDVHYIGAMHQGVSVAGLGVNTEKVL